MLTRQQIKYEFEKKFYSLESDINETKRITEDNAKRLKELVEQRNYYSSKHRQKIVVVWEAGGELVVKELTVDGIGGTGTWKQFVLDGEVILMVKAQHIISIAKIDKEEE